MSVSTTVPQTACDVLTTSTPVARGTSVLPSTDAGSLSRGTGKRKAGDVSDDVTRLSKIMKNAGAHAVASVNLKAMFEASQIRLRRFVGEPEFNTEPVVL